MLPGWALIREKRSPWRISHDDTAGYKVFQCSFRLGMGSVEWKMQCWPWYLSKGTKTWNISPGVMWTVSKDFFLLCVKEVSSLMSQSFLYLGRCNSLCHHFGILRGKLKQRYFCFWWEKKIIKSMKLYSFCLHLKYGKGQERREEKKRHTNWSWQLRFKIISLVILWRSFTSGCSVCVSQPVHSLSRVLEFVCLNQCML